MINNINSLDLLEEITSKYDAVLVYFSHEQCSVCKVLKPKIVDLTLREFPEMKICYIDTKINPEISAQFSIFAAPTILVFFAGKESIRKSRNIGIDELRDLIKRPYDMIFC